ncbi:MAG: hypothetical protein ACTSYB_08870 [Candidatus Helarchaeota archaeon]
MGAIFQPFPQLRQDIYLDFGWVGGVSIEQPQIRSQCPSKGLSKLYPHFYTTWERRKYHSIGGEDQTFAELLCTIGSWTVALATLEEFVAFLA